MVSAARSVPQLNLLKNQRVRTRKQERCGQRQSGVQYTKSLLSYLLLGAAAASAQHISVGVKAGMPLTDPFSTQTFTNVDVITRSFSDAKKFMIGPMLEIRLPLGLAIEADALHHPLDLSVATQLLNRTTSQSSQTIGTWVFPVLGKFRLPFPIVKPYVEAGPSFRRLGGVLDSYWSSKGITFGAGVEFQILKLRVAPELRVTRWGSDPKSARNLVPLSGQNQGDFLVGFSF